ncbi:sensor histidine kinase [Rugamonas rivuli]|uniref:histidine kinase n=1 Tax=Rugamonas rivuli TaxID=2743358 RepID=A0A843SPR3_9BURK|nr:HAMP domain-containing sensor histidine kinase [Rugamonas rivuli]MQA22847.1 sensor histidine kinase [Rugamonas rivuli]
MSASETRSYAAAAGEAAQAEQQLQTLRECLMAHEMVHFSSLLQQLASARLNASQALELEAFQLLARAAEAALAPDELLMPAKSLQLQAQTEQHPLAQAAALRALHWVQMRMRLHHAALDSLAKAAELYERCALPRLVTQMRAARCRVMLSAEMHLELQQFCREMLEQPGALAPPIHVMLLDYAASAAYYLALEEGDDDGAAALWRDCLARRELVLRRAREHGLDSQECLALLNLSMVTATCERAADCRDYMGQLRAKFGRDGYWEPWLALCTLLADCADADADGGARAPAWRALLAYDAGLAGDTLASARLREISLQAIRRYGRRWGHLEQALQAAIRQAAMERRHKRELATSLGETLSAVMERPQLLYQNALLAQHGTVLENSLVQRNQELNSALATLRQEVAVRQATEEALQLAHDRLEQQVRERTADLGEAMRSLMQQEKQLGLSRMVVGMAHELNTPLGNARVAASAITAQAQDLRRGLDAGALRRSQLEGLLDSVTQGGELVDRALRQIGRLVERFKGLSGQTTQEPATRFDLADRLRFCAGNWRRGLQARGITLTLHTPEQLWLHGYPGTCQVVFQHLLDNCLLHAFARHAGGAIVVEARAGVDAVVIDWIDDGCGIAPEHLSQVFEPFYTTQLGQTGTGLGLASVHSMVVGLMKGQVTLDSAPQRGTRVSLSLPYGEAP